MSEVKKRVQQLFKQRDNRIEGKFNCIPFYYHFPRLSKYVPGIFKGSLITLLSGTGIGKCLGKGTEVLMYDGSIKKAEDIEVGDKLMGPDGTVRNVLSTHSGQDNMFRVKQRKGNDYVVNSKHKLSLRKTGTTEVVNISVEDYLKLNSKQKHCLKGYKGNLVNLQQQDIEIDPYFLGMWLGDGNASDSGITTNDDILADYIADFAKQNNHVVIPFSKKGSTAITYHFSNVHDKENDSIALQLKHLGLKNNKHIPKNYLLNSKAVRYQLLAGLIDSDGHLINNCYEIVQKNVQLANDICFLARSLGFNVTVKDKEVSCTNCPNEPDYIAKRMHISGNIDIIPVKLERKKAKPRKINKNALHTGITVEPLGVDDYYGFEVDGDNLFLLSDFTVTHNSKLARYLSVLMPYEISKKYGLKFKVLFFSLEESKEEFIDNMIIMVLKIKHNIVIDRLSLNSHFENTFDEATVKKIEDSIEDVEDIMKHVDVVDTIDNPTGIFLYCKQKSNEWGTHHKKVKMFKENGKEVPKEVYSHYEPNDPEEHVIIVVDHISLLAPEKGETLHQTMSKWSSNYCVKQICKHFNWSVINVQQTMMNADDLNHFKAKKLEPAISDAADNKTVLRDSKLIITLFAPDRYELPTHNGYPIRVLRDAYRSMGIIKNRFGISNAKVPMFFEGATGRFKELPPVDSPEFKKLYNS